MPKMKSHRGLAKRVKKTASGKLKRSRAYTSHWFSRKTTKRLIRKRMIIIFLLKIHRIYPLENNVVDCL